MSDFEKSHPIELKNELIFYLAESGRNIFN